jgi:SOS-response transcriptional repressor LexA
MSPEDRQFILQLSERLTRVQVRLMAIQSLLQESGIPQSDIEARVTEMQARWNATHDQSLSDATETLRQEDLIRLLDKHEGTKQ